MSSVDDKQRKALGKGLSALLPNRPQPAVASSSAPAPSPVAVQVKTKPERLSLDAIEPNPMQPRKQFNQEKLEELAASIRAHGIIQPLIVRETQTGYQIVAGERRWRAARLAGLQEAPVVVQDVADPVMLEVALIENIQRQDLNPIETAQAYERLAHDMGLSQDEIARRTGKDRTSISNTLRLLKLPAQVQLLVAGNEISMGHAKAILGLDEVDEQIDVAIKTASNGWSVRHVENLVQHRIAAETPAKKKQNEVEDANVRAAVEALERVLGTRVRIVVASDQRGRFEIEYYSSGERDRLYDHLMTASF